MQQNNEEKDLTVIEVITSSVCNLNCSFCYLHKNKAYKEFNQNILNAWNDFSYIDNIEKCVFALGHNLDKVEQIHFWGGETLLQISSITKNIPLFYQKFKSLKEWHMSTNWVINVDDFFDFVQTIDKTAPRETQIMVQVSIDGPPGTLSEQGHNGWDFYRENFKKFIHKMNNTKMHNVNVTFHLKSTLSKEDYFNQFSTYEKMTEYMRYMVDFMTEIDELCISRSVNVREKFTLPSIALPHEFTKEDGEKIAEIINLWEEVSYREFPNQNIPFLFGLTEFNFDTIYFDPNRECGQLKDRLMIMYDGTIVECSGTYIDHFKPYQDELLAEGNIDLYHQAIRNSRNAFNPIHASPKEIEKWKWRVRKGYRNNFLTYTMFTNGILKELAESRQISSIYQNPEIRLNRILSFCNSNACTKENSNSTKIPYLMSVGHAREYFNGLVEYGYHQREATMKFEKTTGIDLSHSSNSEQGENKYEYNVGPRQNISE